MKTVRFLLIVPALIVPLGADEPGNSAAQWPRESIFYHVYVRSFADGDGDGHGDLPGLTARLDYIAGLGVDGVLLLPIFQNDHDVYGGYATTDFYRVEDDYGGDAAWEAFVERARQLKLRVLLDLPLTHVADSHPWFVAARSDPGAPEREHFLWAGPPCPRGYTVFGGPAWTPLGDGPCYYSTYGGAVPSLNVRNPATAQALIDVATHWLDRGVSGFRLDSAKHIAEVDPAAPEIVDRSSPATHAFWKRFMTALKAASPQAIAVGEVFDSDATKLTPFYRDGIDMAFDYPIYLGMVDAWNRGKKENLAKLIHASLTARPGGAMGAAFTGNHDVPGTFIEPYGRVADLLRGDPTRLRSAAMLLLSLPSTPFLYYGEEIGLHGAPVPDGKRTPRNPMQWNGSPGRGFTAAPRPWIPFSDRGENVAEQAGRPGSLLETYRRLIRLRRSSPALTRGAYREVDTGHDSLLAFLRSEGSERVLVVVNFSDEALDARLNLRAAGVAEAVVSDKLSGSPLPDLTDDRAAGYPLSLSGYSAVWIALR